MSFTYKYARPAVTTDVVVLHRDDGGWNVLLIQRKHDPYKNCWAVPGGFLDDNEDPAEGAARELEEETGLSGLLLKPLGFWGRPGRDPRGHTVSLVFWTVAEGPRPDAKAADDAKSLAWHPLDDPPELAFDHAAFLKEVRERLTERPE